MEVLIVVTGLVLLGYIWWVLIEVKGIERKLTNYVSAGNVYERNDKLLEEYQAIKAIPELYEDMCKKAQKLAEEGYETVDKHMCRMMEIFEIEVNGKLRI